MSRIRTIKPEFWKHEDLSELPPETHMLAAALLNYSDDEGFFKANPKLVQAECCPLRDDSTIVRRSLEMLAAIGYIRLFTGTDGKEYGHVVKFLDHQRVDRAKPSNIKVLETVGEESSINRRTVVDGSSPEWKGMEGNGREGIAPSGEPADVPPDDQKSKRQNPVTLKTYLENLKAKGEKPFATNDPVYDYAESIGLSDEFLRICWFEFVERYRTKPKKYSDWRRVFRSCVRENWFKLWWLDEVSGSYALTTTGQQAKRNMDSKRAAA